MTGPPSLTFWAGTMVAARTTGPPSLTLRATRGEPLIGAYDRASLANASGYEGRALDQRVQQGLPR